MNIYVDVVIMENFIVDLFILVITCKILKIQTNKIRIIIASIIGGVYSIVMVIPQINIFASIPFQIAISFIIIFIAFNKNRIFIIFKGVGVFILVSIVLSGMCFMFTIVQSNYSVDKSFQVEDNSFKNIILSLIIIYFISCRIIAFIKDRTVVSNFIFDIEFEYSGKISSIKGFLDTGNELSEPSTNLPCILVEQKFLDIKHCSDENLYYISYNAIGVKGILKGVKVDNVLIKKEGKEYKRIVAILCPCEEVLSSNLGRDYIWI